MASVAQAYPVADAPRILLPTNLLRNPPSFATESEALCEYASFLPAMVNFKHEDELPAPSRQTSQGERTPTHHTRTPNTSALTRRHTSPSQNSSSSCRARSQMKSCTVDSA